MKKNNFLLTILAFLVIIFAFFILTESKIKVGKQSGQYLGAKVAHPSVTGGIVPHHLLAGEIIADFFNRLSVQKPEIIILIGPNHFDRGNFQVLTSLQDWFTPDGDVKVEKEIVSELISRNLAKNNNEVLLEEHSITGLTPFIKYYLPQTSIVPLIFSSRTTREEVEVLAENLIDILDKETVIVASVDFSHFLKIPDAQKNDEKTLKIIRSFDYPKLFFLGNDYLDSPASVGLLLVIMDKLGKKNLEVLHHANSGELLNNSFTETTSYFSIIFY